MHGQIAPPEVRDINTTPSISAAAAKEIAYNNLDPKYNRDEFEPLEPELIIRSFENEEYKIVWVVSIARYTSSKREFDSSKAYHSDNPDILVRRYLIEQCLFCVDAHTGEILTTHYRNMFE